MDRDLIDQKLESLRRCLNRVRERRPQTAAELLRDYDAQDILALNLTRAVQLCFDLAVHTVSESELPRRAPWAKPSTSWPTPASSPLRWPSV